jgi:hypothetical protein
VGGGEVLERVQSSACSVLGTVVAESKVVGWLRGDVLVETLTRPSSAIAAAC